MMKKYLLLVALLFSSVSSYANEDYDYVCYNQIYDTSAVWYISSKIDYIANIPSHIESDYDNPKRFDLYDKRRKEHQIAKDIFKRKTNARFEDRDIACDSISQSVNQMMIAHEKVYKNKAVKIDINVREIEEKLTTKKQISKPQRNKEKVTDEYSKKDWWLNATLAMVKQLIKNRDINEPFGNAHETLLHLATYSNDPEIIHFLIESGADIEANNEYNRTPLNYAEYSKNSKMVNTLKKYRHKYYPDVTDCVSIDFNSNSIGNFIHNNCGFGIAVWTCDKNPKHGGGCDKSSYSHFDGLSHVKPHSKTTARKIHNIHYFACGASGKSRHLWHITNNKKNATKFGCKIFEKLN